MKTPDFHGVTCSGGVSVFWRPDRFLRKKAAWRVVTPKFGLIFWKAIRAFYCAKKASLQKKNNIQKNLPLRLDEFFFQITFSPYLVAEVVKNARKPFDDVVVSRWVWCLQKSSKPSRETQPLKPIKRKGSSFNHHVTARSGWGKETTTTHSYATALRLLIPKN